MPIADPEKSRTYQREYKRLVRAGSCQTPGQTQVPTEFRLQTASDVLELLGEQAEAVLNDAELGTVERARTICYLSGALLKAIEQPRMRDALPRRYYSMLDTGRLGRWTASRTAGPGWLKNWRRTARGDDKTSTRHVLVMDTSSAGR
jgi:hypothetical protein